MTFNPFPMVTTQYCNMHAMPEPCFLCRHVQNYNTSIYPAPTPETILANKNPERTAKLIERLSLDRTVDSIAGPVALELARQGHGVHIQARRRGGWFEDDGIEIKVTKT